MPADRVAILLDGGFVKKKLASQLRQHPRAPQIVDLCQTIMEHDILADSRLFRVYYYDALPLDGTAINPLDGTTIDFSRTSIASKNKSLIDTLELEPHFAVRKGELDLKGWKLGDQALKRIGRLQSEDEVALTGKDLVPDISQKGVDIRIGLDIATIALKRVVDALVLVTGDSDLVPAMKLARKEGLHVYLESLGHGIKRELRVHADAILSSAGRQAHRP